MQKFTKQQILKDIKPKYLFTKNITEIIVYHHFGAAINQLNFKRYSTQLLIYQILQEYLWASY
jgi:hypothetical protein